MRRRVPFVIWAYQSRISASQGRGRSAIRRWLLGRADRVVGMGAQARDVLRAWGVTDERIVDAPNSADSDGLAKRLSAPGLDARASQLRHRWADGRKLAIVVGRLVPLKGVDELLRAWRALPRSTREAWRLVFVGDGPLAPAVRAAASTGVRWVGPAPVTEMAAWYRAADLHVLASVGDVWGLVVNEAMAVGTPSLCSVHAGCSDDLISHGKDGLVFDPTEPAQATAALQDALTRPDLAGLGSEARLRIRPYDLDRLASSFRTAVEESLRLHGTRPAGRSQPGRATA